MGSQQNTSGGPGEPGAGPVNLTKPDPGSAGPASPEAGSLRGMWLTLLGVMAVLAGLFTWWAVSQQHIEDERAAAVARAAAAASAPAAPAPAGSSPSPSSSASPSTAVPALDPVTPDPVPSVGDYDGWIANARSVLDDYVATDAQMVTVGLTLCQEVPVTWARADELTSGLGPSLVGLTAQNVMDLSGVAEQTICPGGTILPDRGSPGASEPTPVALPKCPTMKQLKGRLRVVSSRPDPESDYGSRIWLIEIRVTNPRPYPVYLNAEVGTKSQFGTLPSSAWEGSTYVQHLHGISLKPGKSQIRMEVTDSDLESRPLTWVHWAIDGTADVTDEGSKCEQVAWSSAD